MYLESPALWLAVKRSSHRCETNSPRFNIEEEEDRSAAALRTPRSFGQIRGCVTEAGTDRGCSGGGRGPLQRWRANLWKTLTGTRLSSTLCWRWKRINSAPTANPKVGVCQRLYPAADGHCMNRPRLLIYYAGKCGIAFIFPRPIMLYYGAGHGTTSSQGCSMACKLHHASSHRPLGRRNKWLPRERRRR